MSNLPITSDLDALLKHGRWVRALAYSLVADSAAAEDVAQNTWLAAIEKPPSNQNNPRRWLGGVVRNIAGTHWRRQKVRRQRETLAGENRWMEESRDAEKFQPEFIAHRIEAVRQLTSAFEGLPKPYRTTLYLRFFEELTIREIGGRMSVPESTAHARIHRGLEMLRVELASSIGKDWRSQCLLFTVPLLTPSLGLATTTFIMTLKVKLFVGAAALFLASLLVFHPWVDSPEVPNLQPDGNMNSAARTQNGTAKAENVVDPNANASEFLGEVMRETVRPTVSAIKIKDWLGLQVMQGEMYFCNESQVKRAGVIHGRVGIPVIDWTHALVVIPNHAPHFVDRNTITPLGGTGVLQMPEPTFVADVLAEGHSLTEIELVVDYPWVNSDAWPQVLQQSYTIPTELPLQIHPETRKAYFVGAPGSSTTVSCRKEMLIETLGGLAKTVEFPAQSTKERLVLRDFPLLTIGIEPGSVADPKALCRVSTTLTKQGMDDYGTSVLIQTYRYGEWKLPYDPAYTSAAIIVTNHDDGLQLGSIEFELTGSNQLEVVELSQGMTSIFVLDEHENGIPDTVIVQAGATLATTTSAGFARVLLNKDAGKVWFLSSLHDAKAVMPEKLLADPVVYLGAATGVIVSCYSRGSSLTQDNAILFEVEGLSYSTALAEAPGQANEVYGLSHYSSEVGMVAWDFDGVTIVDDGTTFDFASFVFASQLSKQDPSIIRLAGIVEVQQESQVQLILFDAFQQEAWRDSISVSPNQLTTKSIFLDEIFKTISIRVVDAEQNPLVGASVSIGNWFEDEPPSRTDVNGRAALLVSQKANSTLRVQMPGYVSRDVPWPPPAGGDLVSMNLSRQLRIQVLDSGGTRMDVNLILTDGSAQWYGGTKASGVFQFSGIPQGKLRARITQGNSVREFEVPANVETFTLTP